MLAEVLDTSELFEAWPDAGPSARDLILQDLLTGGEESVQVARLHLRVGRGREEALLAVEILSRLCGVECMSELLEAAAHRTDPAVRAAAIRALTVIEAPKAPESVLPFLSEGEPREVLASALSVLGRMGSSEHAVNVEPWLDHSDPTIRMLARFVHARLLETRSQGTEATTPPAPRIVETSESDSEVVEKVLFAADFISEAERVFEELGGTNLAQEYGAGEKKHLVGLSTSYRTVTVTLFLDLDDLLGHSAEGQDGWVTYWLDVKVGFGISANIFGEELPAGLTLVAHGREAGVDDPLRRLHFTAIALSGGGIEVKAGDVGYGGTQVLTMNEAEVSTDIAAASVLTTSATVLKGEIALESIETTLGDALAEESGGVSWPRIAESVVSKIVEPAGFFHHFSDLVPGLSHRPFTSSDDPPAPGSGNPRQRRITEVRAGLDADGDHFADGFVPPSGSGTTPTTLFDLKVFFFSDNAVQDDFRIRVGDLPEGWVIAARAANGDEVGDTYDVFNAVPNALYGTEWYVGCTPSALTTIGVDFELLEWRLLGSDPVLDTVRAALTCKSPPEVSNEPTEFTLTLEKVGGSADGTITTDPSVLSCDADCIQDSATVGTGTEVDLTATPNSGTVFAGWGGACSGTGPCTVTMTEDQLVSASFNPSSVSTNPPSSPSNLQAHAVSTSQIELTWTDTSTDEDGFRVERRDGTNGTWFRIKTLGANATTFTNVSLVPDTTYSYRVYAFNEGGDSGFSNSDDATTFSDAPNPPSNLRAWALSNDEVALAWDDTNSGTASHEIEQSPDGASWSVAGYTGTGDTTFTRTVNPESTSLFRVRAHRSGSGYSAYSSEVEVTACAAPDDPRLESPYSGEDDVPVDRILEWRGDDDVASWDLYLGTAEPLPLVAEGLPNPTPGDDITFDPGGLAEGMHYLWQVVAHAACNPSLTSSSDVEFFTTLGAPDAVELLKPEDGSVDQPTNLVLDWANVTSDGSVLYELHFGKSNPPPRVEDMHTRTEKLAEDLEANTTYHWQVVARAADDPSLTSSSPIWSFTTGNSSATTVELAAIQDAGLRGGSFGNRNYGGDPDGPAEQKAFGTGNDDNFYLDPGSAALRGAVEFDLSSIPRGSNIVNATLTLQWAGGSGSQADPLAMFFAPYTSAWSEGSITWDNRPLVSTTHQVEGSFPLSGFNPTQNDLTPLVQKWVGETVANHGFEVSIPEWESEAFKAKYFYQKEWSSSLAAELQVTYGEPCTAPPAPTSPSPTSGATGQLSPVTLDWADSSGASGYNVYFGKSATPPSHALSASSSLEVTDLAPNTTYHWRVESRAGCDPDLTTSSSTWSFTTSSCLDPAAPTLVSPAHLAAGQPRTVSLSWDPVTDAGNYEVYLGTSNPPTTLVATTSDTDTSVTVNAGTKYFWQVRAMASCDPSRTAASAVRVFDAAAAPQADAGPDQVVPEDTTAVVGGSPSAVGGVGPYLYNWSINPETGVTLSSTTEANPTLTAIERGNYTLQLVVTDADGFSSLPAQALIEVPCSDEEVVLSGETILTPILFEACRTITIGTSVVEGSGELTLRAGEKVILGDGFRVEEGGRLTIEVDQSLQE